MIIYIVQSCKDILAYLHVTNAVKFAIAAAVEILEEGI